MNRKNEQLDRLLLKFMDESQAGQFQNDLSAADDLFDAHPVESIDGHVLKAIQKRMRLALRHHHRYMAITKWCTAAAAVIITAMTAGLFVLYSSGPVTGPVASGSGTSSRASQPVQSQFWSDTLYAVVMETDPIEVELAELTESIQAVHVTPYESPDTLKIDLLEIEEMETLTEKSNFWKG